MDQAMASYFRSTVVVLDGDYLCNPKFINMVKGQQPSIRQTVGTECMYFRKNVHRAESTQPILNLRISRSMPFLLNIG